MRGRSLFSPELFLGMSSWLDQSLSCAHDYNTKGRKRSRSCRSELASGSDDDEWWRWLLWCNRAVLFRIWPLRDRRERHHRGFENEFSWCVFFDSSPFSTKPDCFKTIMFTVRVTTPLSWKQSGIQSIYIAPTFTRNLQMASTMTTRILAKSMMGCSRNSGGASGNVSVQRLSAHRFSSASCSPQSSAAVIEFISNVSRIEDVGRSSFVRRFNSLQRNCIKSLIIQYYIDCSLDRTTAFETNFRIPFRCQRRRTPELPPSRTNYWTNDRKNRFPLARTNSWRGRRTANRHNQRRSRPCRKKTDNNDSSDTRVVLLATTGSTIRWNKRTLDWLYYRCFRVCDRVWKLCHLFHVGPGYNQRNRHQLYTNYIEINKTRI